MKRKALGKGLSALLPEPEPEPHRVSSEASEVPTSSLEPNPYQPRTSMTPAALDELAASIRQSGIVQPILVRSRDGDKYQIIAGERRWQAARALGLERVPVVVRQVPDDELLEIALVENIQREELAPLELATAYSRLQSEFGLNQEQVARKVGKDRSTVANIQRLLRLPQEVKTLLANGRLEAGHARALLPLEGHEEQVPLAREAARKGLSVREVERAVARLRAPRSQKTPRRPDANTRAAEERLRAALGTRVQIVRAGKGGHLKMGFSTEAELNRLFELLLRTAQRR